MLEVSALGNLDFAAIETFMASLFEAEPSITAQTAGLEHALVQRLVNWVAAVQRLQRIPAFGCGHVAPAPSESGCQRFIVATEVHTPQATLESFEWMRGALDLLLPDPADVQVQQQLRASFDAFMLRLQKLAPGGINNFHLLGAANSMGIPARMIVPDIYCYGQGAHARMFNSTLSERTSIIGTNIARRKATSARVLGQHGVPVPRHRFATTADQAARIAVRLGYPVVVKPDDQEQGRGVEAGLKDEASVRHAFEAASQFSKSILVEKHHDGQDYRITVLRDRVVKILHRRAAGVEGDGASTVAQLVKKEQQGPRLRRVLRQTGKQLLEIDAEALGLLREQGLGPADVPAAGRYITLRRRSNISAGGIQTLVPLDEAHPDNLRLAVRASEAVRLDLCGVDMLIPDIRRSWFETGAVIIEVNAQPQIGIMTAPEVYRTILQDSVDRSGRIPLNLLLCAGPQDIPDEPALLAMASQLGCNAVAAPVGLWIDAVRVGAARADGFESGVALVLDRQVTSGLVVMTMGEVISHGLPSDRFETARIHGPAALAGDALSDVLAMIEAHVGEPVQNNLS
ncbi:MAG: acetate--CoA ligase family protein [Pseudomonadota bacterium]